MPEASPQQIEILFERATAAKLNAHAPYSNFHVGAAILTEAGEVFSGCNVENAAYPVGNCAEASAIAAMVTAFGPRQMISSILIVSSGSRPAPPCGACRQRIREFGRYDTEVIMASTPSKFDRMVLDALLPRSFGPEDVWSASP